MEKNKQSPPTQQDPQEGQGWGNILKMVLLAAILVGAWFLLDWLINGK